MWIPGVDTYAYMYMHIYIYMYYRSGINVDIFKPARHAATRLSDFTRATDRQFKSARGEMNCQQRDVRMGPSRDVRASVTGL